GGYVVGAANTEQVKSGVRLADVIDSAEACEDLVGLERNHAAQCDQLVADALQDGDCLGVGVGTPALGNPDRLEADLAGVAAFPELVGHLEGDFLATGPFGRAFVVRMHGGVVLEDDMVDRDPIIETAAFVEVDHLVDGVRRVLLAHIGEGTAVAHNAQWLVSVVEAEEPPRALAVKPVALSAGVLARLAGETVDD